MLALKCSIQSTTLDENVTIDFTIDGRIKSEIVIVVGDMKLTDKLGVNEPGSFGSAS